MKIKALIAVRSGSQRVKNKNIRPFAGSTLLEIKIKQLLRIKNIDGIVVNSNDDNMLEIAKSLGGETVKRKEYYCTNEVSMSEVYKNMAENFNGDIIVYTNVTNPLVKDETIYEAIEKYKEFNDKYDSLNSAYPVKEFLFQNNKPINYDLKNQPRSQDLPDIFALNFAISIISKEKMISQKNVVGSKPYIFPMDIEESTDIDNMIDFEFAEYMYKKNESEVK
jgi:CMP-N,N'-diacetyllegionaminic acid synthase